MFLQWSGNEDGGEGPIVMLTIEEMNVIRSALVDWNGPFPNEEVGPESQKHHDRQIEVKERLIERFEDLLWDWYKMEQHTHAEDVHPNPRRR